MIAEQIVLFIYAYAEIKTWEFYMAKNRESRLHFHDTIHVKNHINFGLNS